MYIKICSKSSPVQPAQFSLVNQSGQHTKQPRPTYTHVDLSVSFFPPQRRVSQLHSKSDSWSSYVLPDNCDSYQIADTVTPPPPLPPLFFFYQRMMGALYVFNQITTCVPHTHTNQDIPNCPISWSLAKRPIHTEGTGKRVTVEQPHQRCLHHTRHWMTTSIVRPQRKCVMNNACAKHTHTHTHTHTKNPPKLCKGCSVTERHETVFSFPRLCWPFHVHHKTHTLRTHLIFFFLDLSLGLFILLLALIWGHAPAWKVSFQIRSRSPILTSKNT